MSKMKFYAGASKVGLPFIEIKDEGEDYGSIWLVDTGSNDNLLFGYVYQQVKDMTIPVEGNYNLYGVDGKKTETIKVKTTLTICNKDCDITFLVREDDEAAKQLSQDMGFPICGIIGSYFMAKHGWVIDLAKQEILIPDTDVSVDDYK